MTEQDTNPQPLPTSQPSSERKPIYIWGLSIGDLAGIANLVVAVLAIGISLYVFIQQTTSDKDQAVTLNQSRDALISARNQLISEQTTLTKVKGDLDNAGAALLAIKGQTATEVSRLRQANAALENVVGATKAQYQTQRRIFAISHEQLDLLRREHAAELARAAARPRLDFNITYISGDKFWQPKAKFIGAHKPILFPIGPEASETFHLEISNVGDATLQSPIVIISDLSKTLELNGPGCVGALPHSIQCNGRDLPQKQGYYNEFNIAAPTHAGTYPIHVQVTSSNLNVRATGFQQTFYLILPAKPH